MLRFGSLLALLAFASFTNGQVANTYPDCVKGKLAGTPICDETQPVLTRAKYLVSLMNVTEKAIRLQNTAPAVDRIGLPAYQWWSEALHGVAGSPGVAFANSGDFSCATSFPEPIGLGATFDRQLIQAISTVTSDEARAFNNAGRAGLDFWTPNINIFRDPRWGRGQETPGEDTFLSSEYVYYLINGYQKGESDQKYYKIVADCKHYAGYDIENWGGNDRYGYNAIISEQDLVETYLPSFKSCLKDAQVGSAMCSYNAVNGVPACANGMLMNDVARNRWNWNQEDQWITSDCGALGDIINNHHYVKNNSQLVQVVLQNGCDIGCDSEIADHGAQAVADGSISEGDLDLALTRTFASLIKLGYFDSPVNQPYRQYGIEKVNTPDSQALTLRAAQESMVLLKNDGLLPLDLSKYKSVAVVGPNADSPGAQIGNYAGRACFMNTPRHSLESAGLTVNYAQGCAINSTSTSGFADALKAAQNSDFIVYVGGIDSSIEAEGKDRDTIDLPGQQSPLIKQLGALGKPFIIVLMNGGSVDVRREFADNNVNAMVWAGYSSSAGGDAIVGLLSGEYSPAGRLPVTWYPNEYISVPMTDQSMRADDKTGNPGRTYKFYTGRPVFPFGYGLSYTTFDYHTINAPRKLAINDLVQAHRGIFDERGTMATTWTVNITNTGSVKSDVSVLAYVSSDATFAGVTPPIKELYDYTRIHSLAPGASEVYTFGLSYRVFSSVDEHGHAWLLPGTYRLALQHDSVLTEEFELVGEPFLIEDSPVSKAKPTFPQVTKIAWE